MPTDIYTLGIQVDSRDVKKADTDLDKLAGAANRADGEIEDLGAQAVRTGKQVNTMRTATRGASAGLGGVSRNAGQAGIQIQQFVGQVQAGTPALTAFSQQGADLGIVLGAPLVGVVLSLGAPAFGTGPEAAGWTPLG